MDNVNVFKQQSTDADIDNQGFTIGPRFPSKSSLKINIV